ncbi:MAG: adenosine deaminase [Chloroflexota bacterium]|nr:adenosine deaminase [Chloroflexota bacterium]
MGADLDLQPLPKAELHQHLDGAMRVETAVALAALAGMSLTADEARRRMVAPDRCESQAELLRYFELPISLLQTEGALRRVAAELVADLVADGVRYAEVRWAPRLHLEGGLSVAEVIAAVAVGIAEAAAEIGPRTPLVGLIVTAMRSHPPAANVQLAHDAVAFGPPVVGFDLAGDEAGFPAPPHAAAFVVAREGGLGLSVHAGEVPGVEHIVEALDLGARRIAHGVTAIDDPSLVQRLRDLDVTLDLCPTSNVQSGVVSGLAAHPAARLHRAGVSVTLSTDDRTVSGTTLSAELARTAAALQLSRAELAQIALNGFRRGFAPSGMRAPLIGEAERAWSSWAARTARPAHPTRAARAG